MGACMLRFGIYNFGVGFGVEDAMPNKRHFQNSMKGGCCHCWKDLCRSLWQRSLSGGW